MSLFACRECCCVENTACCNYWLPHIEGRVTLCSECDPDIGKWHGQFAKRPAAGYLVDHEGHLWRVASQVPKHCKILGSVAAKESP